MEFIKKKKNCLEMQKELVEDFGDKEHYNSFNDTYYRVSW